MLPPIVARFIRDIALRGGDRDFILRRPLLAFRAASNAFGLWLRSASLYLLWFLVVLRQRRDVRWRAHLQLPAPCNPFSLLSAPLAFERRRARVGDSNTALPGEVYYLLIAGLVGCLVCLASQGGPVRGERASAAVGFEPIIQIGAMLSASAW